MKIETTRINAALNKPASMQQNNMFDLSKGFRKQSPGEGDDQGIKILGGQAALSAPKHTQGKHVYPSLAMPEEKNAMETAAQLQETMENRQAILPSEREKVHEKMDALLNQSADTLSDEEKGEIRIFLESGELANYLTRPPEGYDIKTLDIRDSIEKFSNRTSRIQENLAEYYAGESGNISRMERVTDALDKAGSLLAANIGKTVKNYTMQTYNAFDVLSFANGLDDAIAQRTQVYSSFYANLDDALSYDIRTVEQMMTDPNSAQFQQSADEIKVEHAQYGTISYTDITEFADFLSDMEKEIDERRKDIEKNGIMGAGQTLGAIYGKHLKKAEGMKNNPFAEEIYQATLRKVAQSMSEDMEALEKEARKMGLSPDMINEMKEQFKSAIESEIARHSDRYKLENSNYSVDAEQKNVFSYMKQEDDVKIAFHVSNNQGT